jgi:hypothetical protein
MGNTAPVDELRSTLEALGFEQLTLAFTFFTAYSLVLSPLAGSRWRAVAALVALAAALAFVARTRPWDHAALLVLVSVAGMGLFVAGVWVLSLLAGSRRRGTGDATAEGPVSRLPTPAPATPPDGGLISR